MVRASRVRAALVVLAVLAPSGALGCGEGRPAEVPGDVDPDAENHPYDPVVAGMPESLAHGGPKAGPSVGAAPTSEAVPIAGSEYVRGRATVLVRAPIERVRDAVADLARYTEFMPRYKTSTLVGNRAAGAREVYLEVEALQGTLRMWAAVSRPFPTPDGAEAIETRVFKGNVKTFEAVWRLRRADRGTTLLTLDVFLDPGMPIPADLLNKENVGAAVDGVAAMRTRVERGRR
jgi:ribosome-associated toxin RatA of RatAB toxin-antitoxin module